MIEKPLDEITYADIEGFVQAGWAESKTIEYKREMYRQSDGAKKELLKDVSSFANTQGGDILIGIEEEGGVSTGIPGVELSGVDSEILRLEETIRQGLEPRIDFAIHHVATPSSRAVLIIRIKESLLLPHRVVLRGQFGGFWARSSAGKFSMDTNELRTAFTLSSSVFERIVEFRQNRVLQILKDETPVPLIAGAKLALHLVPVSSFRSRHQVNVADVPELRTLFPPLACSGWDHRLNLDGHLNFNGGERAGGIYTYTQFFRNGVVESVLAGIARESDGEVKLLDAPYYEYHLTQRYRTLARFLDGLKQLEFDAPIWCFLSLVGVKGTMMPSDSYFSDERREIDCDVLLLPEAVINDVTATPVAVLRPLFDLAWNASGSLSLKSTPSVVPTVRVLSSSTS